MFLNMSNKRTNHIKQTGATFTPERLAIFLAEKLLSYQCSNNLIVLDPACGDGALLLAISKLLIKRNLQFELKGYDSNNEYLNIARQNLTNIGVKSTDLVLGDFLEIVDLKKEQLSFFKTDSSTNEFADMIIANPPYVRTQILGSEQSQALSKKFGLKGRVDLYYPFLIAMTHALKQGGFLGVITSNRYLSTKSGESIRKFLNDNYEIIEVIDLGDTKLFNAAVLPAIFIGKKKTDANNTIAKFLKIYEELNGYNGKVKSSTNIYDILSNPSDGYFSDGYKRYKKSSGILKLGKTIENSWTMLSAEEAEWVSKLEQNSHCIVGDIFKVRVGIKTTADKVFISDKWDSFNDIKPEDELLKDLISQENIKSWSSCNKKKLKVLYPHFAKKGKIQTIKLNDYPQAYKYFKQHEERLSSRKYVIEAGRNWYEIWVPQNPALWPFPKLVFPDISLTPRFYFDDTGKIVNGNCYWIVAQKPNYTDKLFLIQGIANSKLMTKYHDLVFINKLYSGRRRYFSQYVENYPLPAFDNPKSKAIIEIVKHINQDSTNNNIEKLTIELEERVAKAYNVDPIFSLD